MVGVDEDYLAVDCQLAVVLSVDIALVIVYDGGSTRAVHDLRDFLPEVVRYCSGGLAVLRSTFLTCLCVLRSDAIDVLPVGIELVIAALEGDLGYEHQPDCESHREGEDLEDAYVEFFHNRWSEGGCLFLVLKDEHVVLAVVLVVGDDDLLARFQALEYLIVLGILAADADVAAVGLGAVLGEHVDPGASRGLVEYSAGAGG